MFSAPLVWGHTTCTPYHSCSNVHDLYCYGFWWRSESLHLTLSFFPLSFLLSPPSLSSLHALTGLSSCTAWYRVHSEWYVTPMWQLSSQSISSFCHVIHIVEFTTTFLFVNFVVFYFSACIPAPCQRAFKHSGSKVALQPPYHPTPQRLGAFNTRNILNQLCFCVAFWVADWHFNTQLSLAPSMLEEHSHLKWAVFGNTRLYILFRRKEFTIR